MFLSKIKHRKKLENKPSHDNLEKHEHKIKYFILTLLYYMLFNT